MHRVATEISMKTAGNKINHTVFFLLLVTFFTGIACPAVAAPPAINAGAQPQRVPEQTAKIVIDVLPDQTVSASIDNRTQAEVLRAMAGKNLFEIKGSLPPGETVSISFSGLTLDEALKKLMRGYNYVLLSQGPTQKPVLTVMGKVERAKATEQRVQPSPSPLPVPVPVGQAADTSRSYVPPSPPAEPPAGKNQNPQAVRAGGFARPGGPASAPGPSGTNQSGQAGQESTGRTPAGEGKEKNDAPLPESDSSANQAQQTRGQPQPVQTGSGFGQENDGPGGSSAKTLMEGVEQK
jgi:hypothetical protein